MLDFSTPKSCFSTVLICFALKKADERHYRPDRRQRYKRILSRHKKTSRLFTGGRFFFIVLLWIQSRHYCRSGLKKSLYKLGPVFPFKFLRNVFNRDTTICGHPQIVIGHGKELFPFPMDKITGLLVVIESF